MLFEDAIEGSAREELKGHVERSRIRVATDIVNGDNSGMSQPSRALRLRKKPGLKVQPICAGCSRWGLDDLQRNLTTEVRVVSQVDNPHHPLPSSRRI